MTNSAACCIDRDSGAERRFPARGAGPHRRGLRLVPSRPPIDGEAYEALALEHRPFLFARAMSLARNREEAEDLVQETLIKALRNFHQFRPGTNGRAWLGRILKNTFISQWRSRGGREPRVMTPLEDAPDLVAPPSATDPVDPFETVQLLEQERAVETVLESVPDRYRATLRLHLLGLSYREIAERLSVPVGTVMSRLHRARRHAKAFLRDSGEALGLGAGLSAARG